MAELVNRRKTDYIFNMVVRMNTAFSVGAGFYNTANTDSLAGRKCLEVIDDFCDEWNLDELNQLIAIDAWTSGNAFLDIISTEKIPMAGIRILPLSSFIKIHRDEDAQVLQYEQNWGGRYLHVDAKHILHFKLMPEDSSAWGTGIGQILCRDGMGYKTTAGSNVTRPSFFEAREMMGDVTIKTAYAGMPRWAVKAKDGKADDVAKLTNMFGNLDPLQNIVHNMDTEIQNLSLEIGGKYEPFYRHLSQETIAATLNPLIQLWTSMSFTYASAKEAIDAMMPIIRGYQRSHKRFIENHIYKPIIMDAKGMEAVKKADVRINWGEQEPMELEAIKDIYEILKDPKFDGLYDPADIIDLLRDAGARINPTQQAQMSRQFRDLEKLKNAKEKKIPISALPKDQQLQEIKLQILRKIQGRT